MRSALGDGGQEASGQGKSKCSAYSPLGHPSEMHGEIAYEVMGIKGG